MRVTRIWRAAAVLGIPLLLALTPVSSSLAQQSARSVSWQHFDVDLAVQPTGSLLVSESQTIQFNGTFQGGYRVVPLDRATGATDVSVTEVQGDRSIAYTRGSGSQPNTYSSSIGNDGLRIDWSFPPTTNSTRTFLLTYAISGAVRIYDAGDQLQWRAIYPDRDGAITNSSVTVHLPGDLDANRLQTAWYQLPATAPIGALSQSGSATQIDARTVRFTTGYLPPRVGAEVRVQFPHGLISASPPDWQTAADRADALAQSVAPIGNFLSLLMTLAILAAGVAFLILRWLSSGRDPAVGSVPAVLQEPPSDLPAPLAGTLVDEYASEREAVAALVELADRGIVQLTDEQNPALVGSQTDVRITLNAPPDDSRLRGYERSLLAALFGSHPKLPAEVLLSSVKAQFKASIPAIEAQLYDSVAREGLFARNPESTRRTWIVVGFTAMGVGGALAIGGAAVLAGVVGLIWLPGAALAVVGLAAALLAGSMPRRTQTGALEAAKWRAFGKYLQDAVRTDKPAAPLPPHYLSYAVAFGVETGYVKHLESVGTPPPVWYRSGQWQGGPGPIVFVPGGWYGGGWRGQNGSGAAHVPVPGGGGISAPPAPNPQGWSDALAALLNAASQAMAHGGGSGGWSGGGFGGGGGGGGGSGGFR